MPKTFGPRKRIRPQQNYSAPHPFAFPPRLAVKAPRDAAAKQAENGMQEPYGKSDKNWVLGVAALASFMVALDTQVLTAALATIRAEFGAPMEALQWTVNAFNLSFAVLLLTGAALGDRFGRRRMFAAGLTVFVAASIMCAVAGNAAWLLVGRVLQGDGAAVVVAPSMSVSSASFGR